MILCSGSPSHMYDIAALLLVIPVHLWNYRHLNSHFGFLFCITEVKGKESFSLLAVCLDDILNSQLYTDFTSTSRPMTNKDLLLVHIL